MDRIFSPMRTVWRLFAVSLMAVPLAGCWYSEAPLVDASHASVFPHAGKYADPEGGRTPLTIAARPDGAYDLIGGDSTIRAWFLDIGGDWYVYQMDAGEGLKGDGAGAAQGGEDQKMFLYDLMHYSGGTLFAYDPDCDARTAAVPGIEDDGHSGCRIANRKALKLAARRFADAIESGETTGEPQVFRPWSGD